MIKNHPVAKKWLSFIKGIGAVGIVKIVTFLETQKDWSNPSKLLARVGAMVVGRCPRCGYIDKHMPSKRAKPCPRCGAILIPEVPYKGIIKYVHYSPRARDLIRSTIVMLIIRNWQLYKQGREVGYYFKHFLHKAKEKYEQYIGNKPNPLIKAVSAAIWSTVKLFLSHLYEVTLTLKTGTRPDIKSMVRLFKQHGHVYIPPLVDVLEYREYFYRHVLNMDEVPLYAYARIDEEFTKATNDKNFLNQLDKII